MHPHDLSAHTVLTISHVKPVTVSGLGQAPFVAVTTGVMGAETVPARIWVVLAQNEYAAAL